MQRCFVSAIKESDLNAELREKGGVYIKGVDKAGRPIRASWKYAKPVLPVYLWICDACSSHEGEPQQARPLGGGGKTVHRVSHLPALQGQPWSANHHHLRLLRLERLSHGQSYSLLTAAC